MSVTNDDSLLLYVFVVPRHAKGPSLVAPGAACAVAAATVPIPPSPAPRRVPRYAKGPGSVAGDESLHSCAHVGYVTAVADSQGDSLCHVSCLKYNDVFNNEHVSTGEQTSVPQHQIQCVRAHTTYRFGRELEIRAEQIVCTWTNDSRFLLSYFSCAKRILVSKVSELDTTRLTTSAPLMEPRFSSVISRSVRSWLELVSFRRWLSTLPQLSPTWTSCSLYHVDMVEHTLFATLCDDELLNVVLHTGRTPNADKWKAHLRATELYLVGGPFVSVAANIFRHLDFASG